MKYGLVTFKETENIGDDIQSYSAKKFLPHIDYYVEREKLDTFIPDKEEKVITLMNGWYLHNKLNFPPSPYIYPLFVSTHFSKYDSNGIEDEYINEYFKNKLNKYFPIGCRDTNTMEFLEKNNIPCYFSGCLTLSIDKDNNLDKKNQICIVDIEEEAEKYIKENLKDIEIIKKTHVLKKEENSKLSWEERFKNVKDLLDIYQQSKLVITSRLHCALPCLALGTSVLLLYDEDKMYTKDRLYDYVKIINHMSTKEFLESGIERINNGIENPEDYIDIRNNVIKYTEKLISETKDIKEEVPLINDYKKYYIEPKKNIDNILDMTKEKYSKIYDELIEANFAIEYWKKEWQILCEKYDSLRNSQE